MFKCMTSAELSQAGLHLPRTSELAEPTWGAMVAIAPDLLDCERAAAMADPGDCRAWSGIKRKFSLLVGWEAADSRLRDSLFYDLAYDRILAAFEGGEAGP